jgi:hypothetical protein
MTMNKKTIEHLETAIDAITLLISEKEGVYVAEVRAEVAYQQYSRLNTTCRGQWADHQFENHKNFLQEIVNMAAERGVVPITPEPVAA